MPGELKNAGKRGPEGQGKKRTDCVTEDRRVFGIMGDWSTAALDPGVWYSTVCEGDCRFTAAWVRKKENALKNRQRKTEARKRWATVRLHLE